jgi:hypothetical protein
MFTSILPGAGAKKGDKFYSTNNEMKKVIRQLQQF